MNISKENLFLLLDEFGENLLFEPEAGYAFSLDVTRKLDNIDYIKNNLDKPFTVYTDENGKQTVETLYDFIKNLVWGIDIRAGYDNNLGISKDVTIRVPKKKEIDVSWVWDKINKAQDRTSQNISKLGNQLCSKLNLPSTVARGTSFGVSIQNLYRESKADEEAKQITDFLDKHSISYRDRYSWGHWNIWIVISKEKQNLDRLEKALNTKKENMIRTMIRRKRVCEHDVYKKEGNIRELKRGRKVNENFVNPSDDILDAWEMFCNYFKKDRDYVIVREGKLRGDPIVIASVFGDFILTAIGNYDDITIHLATMDDYPSRYKISTKEEMKEWLRKVWLVDV